MGRKALSDKPMTNAERQAKYRQIQKTKESTGNLPNENSSKNTAELVDYCITLENELEDLEKRYNDFANRMHYILKDAAKPFGFRIEIENNEIVFKCAMRFDGDSYIERFYFKELLNGDFISHKKLLSEEFSAE